MLDGGTDQPPPHFKTGLCWGIVRILEPGIAEQDGIERSENFGAIVVRPSDRVGMLELPVLGVGAVDTDADMQGARGEIAAWGDVVAGEEVDGRGRRTNHFAHAELTVGVVGGSAGPLD